MNLDSFELDRKVESIKEIILDCYSLHLHGETGVKVGHFNKVILFCANLPLMQV